MAGLLDDVEGSIFEIAQDRYKAKTIGMKEHVMSAISSIHELYDRRGSITGLPTGLADLDKLTDGLHAAEMIVIAARPSMGKTALAMNIAEHIAVDLNKPVAVFSLEMSSQQLVQRLLCSRAKVNLGRVRDGFLSERDFPALTAAASKLAETKIFIDDTAGLSILELRAKARRLKSQHKIEANFVDYLRSYPSFDLPARAGQSPARNCGNFQRPKKPLAKELALPIVVLAQAQPES